MRALSTPLAAPSAVSAASGLSGGTVTAGLSFTGNNNPAAARYEVRYRNTTAGSPYQGPIVAVSGQQLEVGGAARNLYMQVRAVNNATGDATAWVGGAATTGINVSAR